MLFSKHIINPSRVATAADLAGAYPIGLSVEQFLDLFADVKSFSANGTSVIDTSSITNDAYLIQGSLNNLDSFNAGGTAVFAGSSKRKILPVGVLQSSGADLLPGKAPNALVDYPVHSMGGSGGLITIDFGKTVCYAGLLFPHFLVQFSTGMGNLASGAPVGFISFEKYGIIVINGGPQVSSPAIGFASGSIQVKERYSSLRADSLQARVGADLTFTSGAVQTSFASYQNAFFGAARAEVSSSASTLSVTVPVNAKSGPVRFASEGPQFDSFLSYDEIQIIS